MTTMFHEQEFDDMPAARFDGQFYDDADLDRVRTQAEILGKRLPTSVPPSELH